jgi:hypothetical protein
MTRLGWNSKFEISNFKSQMTCPGLDLRRFPVLRRKIPSIWHNRCMEILPPGPEDHQTDGIPFPRFVQVTGNTLPARRETGHHLPTPHLTTSCPHRPGTTRMVPGLLPLMGEFFAVIHQLSVEASWGIRGRGNVGVENEGADGVPPPFPLIPRTPVPLFPAAIVREGVVLYTHSIPYLSDEMP